MNRQKPLSVSEVKDRIYNSGKKVCFCTLEEILYLDNLSISKLPCKNDDHTSLSNDVDFFFRLHINNDNYYCGLEVSGENSSCLIVLIRETDYRFCCWHLYCDVSVGTRWFYKRIEVTQINSIFILQPLLKSISSFETFNGLTCTIYTNEELQKIQETIYIHCYKRFYIMFSPYLLLAEDYEKNYGIPAIYNVNSIERYKLAFEIYSEKGLSRMVDNGYHTKAIFNFKTGEYDKFDMNCEEHNRK